MNIEDARRLIGTGQVYVTRYTHHWKGRVMAVVEQPCLILEDEAGRHVAVVLADTHAEVLAPKENQDG